MSDKNDYALTPEGALGFPEEGDVDNTRAVIIESAATRRFRQDLQKAAPMPEGTVIRFESVDDITGRSFLYAGVFVAGKWFLTTTGNSYWPSHLTHGDLVARIAGAGHRVQNLEVAVGFEGVVL